MKHLLIVETNITNPSWVQEYLVKVTPVLAKFSGKYLTRTSSIEILEGEEKPQYSLVAEFPTKEDAIAFHSSEEYAPLKAARQSGSVSKFLLVPVENGTA
ncbi:DUF1330 domain-containing protein [Pseudoalteromonas tunicata]|uniref:DUF1330 domain-containing protein n=1 Tax=Pseudoalteromonas tunicata TaxID=314281 RepID=UPI00273F40BC|nr:DUF1330 domain-containing protein [Pseudoalteromonas tunicata]MDP5211951.1 DUF1330 domain-containing protein [Pseudoalteromonas tunicata]